MVWVIQRLSSLRSHPPVGVAQLWIVRPRMPHGLMLPFDGSAFVIWGGDTPELNHHHAHPVQRYAFDFTTVPSVAGAQRHVNSEDKNEDFLIFGRTILCPLDGVVVEAVDGLRDNRPRQMNERMVSGNFVLIKHSNSVFMHLSHLKCGSVLVRAGAVVKRGEVLAACGNSGRSTEPHLHFHVQSDDRIGNPKGLKCWFEKVRVAREVKHDYSPVRGDIVENVA